MIINFDTCMKKDTKIIFDKLINLNEIKEWTLIGGTALAIHLNHRLSEDLDFFIYEHKLNNNLLRNIDNILNEFRKKYEVINILDEENQKDYLINNVRITFCSSRDFNYKKEIITYKNINISNINALAAMKMLNVLKYRTKLRDFYDLKSIIDLNIFNFNDLINNFSKYFPNIFYEKSVILNRFITKKLDVDDEGLELLNDENINFKILQNYFKNIFINLNKEYMNVLLNINNIEQLKHKLFDITNISLEILLLENKRYDIYEILLKENLVNYHYKNIEGKNIFDILINENQLELFDKTFYYLANIEEYIVFKSKDKLDFEKIINKHKIINRLLDKDDEYILSFLKNKNLNESLKDDIVLKRNCLNFNNQENLDKNFKSFN